jgi:DNA-binding transcriptional ArsR family regulator
MGEWSFLTNHARALVCIAHDPGVRLRDIASALHITERSAYGIVSELADAGYVVKEKDGRRNRYEIQGHLPLRGTVGHERTIGDVLDVLVETSEHAHADPTRQSDASRGLPGRAGWRWRAQTRPRD